VASIRPNRVCIAKFVHSANPDEVIGNFMLSGCGPISTKCLLVTNVVKSSICGD
jgi:hypothetical protein